MLSVSSVLGSAVLSVSMVLAVVLTERNLFFLLGFWLFKKLPLTSLRCVTVLPVTATGSFVTACPSCAFEVLSIFVVLCKKLALTSPRCVKVLSSTFTGFGGSKGPSVVT